MIQDPLTPTLSPHSRGEGGKGPALAARAGLAATPTRENSLVLQNRSDASRAVGKALLAVETIAKYRRRFKRLQEMRYPVESFWRDVRDHLDPAGASVYLDNGDGTEPYVPDVSKILDGMPRKMAQTAADGLHGGLSSPSSPWFSYYVGIYDKYDSEAPAAVKDWVAMAQECVRDVLAATNFYSVIHSVYRDIIEFGVSLMIGNADPDKLVRFYHYKPGSYWLGQDKRRIIDTAYIKHSLRASDIADTYGIRNCPQIVRDCLGITGDSDRKFTVIQCIQPWNTFGDAKSNPRGYHYEDVRFVWEADDTDPILYRGGYVTKPFVVARWSEPDDDVYPMSCPGIDALQDIKQLYKATEDYNLAVEWRVNPAFAYNSQAIPNLDGIKPGDTIPVAGGVRDIAVQAIVPPVHDLASSFQECQALVERISATLYNREIMMISGRAMQNHQMTATEAQLLDGEKAAVMGPIVVRSALNVLVPSLDRTFEIVTREWVVLDEPPEEIRGREIRPYFTSDLAVSQRQAEMQRINLFDQWLLGVVQAYPPVLQFVDMEKRIRLFEKFDYIPPGILHSPEEIKEAMAKQEQAAQAQQQLLAVQQGSEIARNLGGASTEPGTALGDMTGGEANG